MLETPFYIACLRLSGRRCVVVGGGDVGLEKVEGLLACDADVTLIAPEAHPELVQLGLEGSIRWEAREYESGDLDGALIAIAATDDTDLNIRVFEEAEARAMLVNVVDVPPLCNFILPAIVRDGPARGGDLDRRRVAGAGQTDEAGDRGAVRRAVRAAGDPAQRRARVGEGDASHLSGPQGVLRVDRQRRSRPDRAAAGRGCPGGAGPDRRRAASGRARGRVSELTHLDASGRARMVDVGDKPASERRAVARAVVRVAPETARKVAAGDAPKGDVLGVARIAGIQAAKRTAELIPLCHPLGLSFVGVEGSVDAESGAITLVAEARTTGQTGVEMEAMTAASVAALTVYDMVKGLERGAEIAEVVLLEKSGGRSGHWTRDRAD